MKCFPPAVAALVILTASSLVAQLPGEPPLAPVDTPATTDQLVVVSPGEVMATPEMWFYEQELRRWENPQELYRWNAAQRAAQRRARLTAMKWYGLSNSRPQASIDVVHGPYSPQWVGNGYNPYQWVGPAASSIIVVPTTR